VPADLERVATAAPNYRSSYVLLMPADVDRPLASLDNPTLRDLRIGVQPADNLRGYSVYGDYAKPAPPQRSSARSAPVPLTWRWCGG
jgi:hypothetical protein